MFYHEKIRTKLMFYYLKKTVSKAFYLGVSIEAF
jgi:hypothetical protein